MTTQRDIKNTYFDALFFASSTINEGKDFHLTPAQFRLFLKLIHYSTHEENITWSSENISKHLCTSIDSIDKSIQRLRQKGYINVINKQRNATTRSRTIYINWEFILEVDGLFKNHLNLTEEIEVLESEFIQPEFIQPEPSQPESDEIEIQEEEQEETKLSIADLINQLPPVPLDEIENASNVEKVTKQELINFTENTNLDKNDKRIILKNIESGKIKSKEDLQESITLIKILN
jgi:DNA-binding MarR family transcriptional regulator